MILVARARAFFRRDSFFLSFPPSLRSPRGGAPPLRLHTSLGAPRLCLRPLLRTAPRLVCIGRPEHDHGALVARGRAVPSSFPSPWQAAFRQCVHVRTRRPLAKLRRPDRSVPTYRGAQRPRRSAERGAAGHARARSPTRPGRGTTAPAPLAARRPFAQVVWRTNRLVGFAINRGGGPGSPPAVRKGITSHQLTPVWAAQPCPCRARNLCPFL